MPQPVQPHPTTQQARRGPLRAARRINAREHRAVQEAAEALREARKRQKRATLKIPTWMRDLQRQGKLPKTQRPSVPTLSKRERPLPAPGRSLRTAVREPGRVPPPSRVKGVEMIPVESSNVAAYGYNESAKVMFVSFHNGGVYQYDEVQPDVWARAQAAPSKGKFVWRELRDRYPYRRIA